MTPKTLQKERREKFESIISEWLANSPAITDVTGDEALLKKEIMFLAFDLAKSSQSRTEVRGIEAAMFADRDVTEEDKEADSVMALEAFERDMQCPGSWSWYPAKSSDEPAWKALRDFVVRIYQSDPKAFEKYYTWSRQPYSRGAMTVLAIKRNPADFELSWAAYFASDMYVKKTDEARPVYRAEPEPEYVPAPKRANE